MTFYQHWTYLLYPAQQCKQTSLKNRELISWNYCVAVNHCDTNFPYVYVCVCVLLQYVY